MNHVVSIVGPTGVGKTALGIKVAKKFNGEVISGDSMQIYKGMDIGTAKVTKKEKQQIPHHMIDIKEPSEAFSAAEFQTAVTERIEDIHLRRKLPVMVGGTGLYIQSVLYGYNFPEKERNTAVQHRLEEELGRYGGEYLWERLNDLDPDTANKIHPNNHRRLIRALEVIETEGKTITSIQSKQSDSSFFTPIIIGLEMDREKLYERINYRVDQMMEAGLLEEVRFLYERGLENTQALQAIGYKEFIPYFQGNQSIEESIRLLKRNSRRYAKRQYTWFRNKMNVNWYELNPETVEETHSIILEDLAGMLGEK